MTEVNPADLRFTQDSIACHFKTPHEHFSIWEGLNMIQTGEMSPDDFPRLRVISYDGCLWSIDNRRLWVFRKGKCSLITVDMMSTMHPRLLELISLRSRYARFSTAEFFPRVRKSQSLSPLYADSGPKSPPRVPEIMRRCGSRVQGSQNVTLGPLPRVASENLPPIQFLRGHYGGLGTSLSTVQFSPNPFVVTMEGWPPLPCGLLSRNPSVVARGLLNESSNSDAREPFSAWFSGSLGGGDDREPAVTRTQPTNEPNIDLVWSPCHSTGTQEQQSRLEQQTCHSTGTQEQQSRLEQQTCHSTGTQEQQSRLEQQTSEHPPLLPASTDDDGPPTQSWFARVKNLMVGFFGRG